MKHVFAQKQFPNCHSHFFLVASFALLASCQIIDNKKASRQNASEKKSFNSLPNPSNSYLNLTENQFCALFEEKKKEYLPTQFWVNVDKHGIQLYNVVWAKKPEQIKWKLFKGLNRIEAHQLLKTYASQEYYPVTVNVNVVKGSAIYNSVWVKGKRSFRMHNKMTTGQFNALKNVYKEEFHLVTFNKFIVENQSYYAAVWLGETMDKSLPKMKAKLF